MTPETMNWIFISLTTTTMTNFWVPQWMTNLFKG